MNKNQAWSVVDQACSVLQLTREQHQQLEQALHLLKPESEETN